MNKQITFTILLALVTITGQAQKHLPEISYSKKPAVLSGRIIKDGAESPDTIYLRCLQPYTSGMGDALWRTAVPLVGEGKFKADIPMLMTTACKVCLASVHFPMEPQMRTICSPFCSNLIAVVPFSSTYGKPLAAHAEWLSRKCTRRK